MGKDQMTTPLNEEALEAAAKELFLEEENTAYVPYPEWDSPENVGKPAYIENARAAVSAYLAVAQPVVNTVEELDALPEGSVVLDSQQYPYRRQSGFTSNYWEGVECGDPLDIDTLIFPATVIYRPEVPGA